MRMTASHDLSLEPAPTDADVSLVVIGESGYVRRYFPMQFHEIQVPSSAVYSLSYLHPSPIDHLNTLRTAPLPSVELRHVLPLSYNSNNIMTRGVAAQAQVAVADVLGGADLEMLLGDMSGNVACVNGDGDVLWDVQVRGRRQSAGGIVLFG